MTSLIPSGTGTGGGDGDYTFRQMAMFGVKPGDTSGDIQPEDAPIGMYSDLTSEEFKTFLSLPVTLTARIANYDSEPFAGAISAGVFDRSGALVEYLDTIEIEDLPSEGDTLLTFTRQKKELILTGKYIAKLFYADSSKVEGEGDKAEWVLIPDSTGINYTEFEVYYPAEMEVYSPFVIKGDSLVHLKTATVGVAVSNEGMANFKGKYRLSLSGLDGIFAQDIATVTDMSGSLAPGYYIPLEFKGKITVPPGDYLMELSYMPSGKNQWYYAGSSYYQNPIRVRVGGTLEPVGVEEVVEQEVTIYPNPAKDYAIIRTENGYSKIVLSDIQGRIVYTTTGNNTAMTAEIPLANVGSGVYVVQIYSDNKVVTRKIIVQK